MFLFFLKQIFIHLYKVIDIPRKEQILVRPGDLLATMFLPNSHNIQNPLYYESPDKSPRTQSILDTDLKLTYLYQSYQTSITDALYPNTFHSEANRTVAMSFTTFSPKCGKC